MEDSKMPIFSLEDYKNTALKCSKEIGDKFATHLGCYYCGKYINVNRDNLLILAKLNYSFKEAPTFCVTLDKVTNCCSKPFWVYTNKHFKSSPRTKKILKHFKYKINSLDEVIDRKLIILNKLLNIKPEELRRDMPDEI